MDINIVCAIPELSDKLVKEDREYYSSKFITRAQPWPSSKWRKHIPCACCSGIALFQICWSISNKYKQEMHVCEWGGRGRESYLPPPWIKSASIFEMVMVQMYSSKWCKNLPSLRNCITCLDMSWYLRPSLPVNSIIWYNFNPLLR